MTTGYEIPKEEVDNMSPQDFVGTYTHRLNDPYWEWIQYNKKVDDDGDLWGLAVLRSGRVMERGGWFYAKRCNTNRKHYKSLEDLVRGCDDEELLELFLREHCQ